MSASSSTAKAAGNTVALNQANLKKLTGHIQTPNYDRSALSAGIVHMGFGGFHRAHMARYTHDLMQQDFASAKDWGICGVGLMPADKKMEDALKPQNFLYTLVAREGKDENVAIVGSVCNLIFAGESTDKLLAQIENPQTRIVSLTVTENGYCLNPDTRKLDPNHPLIKADLANPTQPRSAIGVIVEGYKRRMDKGLKGFTALSCDNIQHNGKVLREAVTSYAKLRDAKLAAWIEQNASFPNTMVDRITPVTKQEDITTVAVDHGIVDNWPVVCESFTQWVIEDNFVNGRPAWEKVGAQFVPDVSPYETMKLRLLNASHLAVACLGDLNGYTYIDETLADPLFQKYMAILMDKQTGPTVPPVPGIDLPAYKARLIARFANPAIKDTVERVATDAPLNTVLDSIRDRLKANADVDLLALTLAGWLRRVRGGKNEKGRDINVRHPLKDLLRDKGVEGGSNPKAMMSITQLFGDLGNDERLMAPLRKHLEAVYAKGACGALQEALG